MPEANDVLLGIAWYQQEQWELLLSVIPDPEVFPHTYSEWSSKASEMFDQMTVRGFVVRKVDVEVGALLAWATACGKSPDGAARAEYVQELVRR